MSQTTKCPDGFEKGTFFSCRAVCPAGFKYQQDEVGGAGPPIARCVHINYNNVRYNLTALPQLEPTEPEPTSYAAERTRIENELVRVAKEVADIDTLREAKRQREKIVQDYSAIDTKYSAFRDTVDGIEKLKKLNETLKPLRPATAPTEDYEKERIAVLSIENRDLFFIQFSLFLLVLVFLGYLTLSIDTAHVLAFLLLSVGVSIGFFLTR
jgi:hypothetical protein